MKVIKDEIKEKLIEDPTDPTGYKWDFEKNTKQVYDGLEIFGNYFKIYLDTDRILMDLVKDYNMFKNFTLSEKIVLENIKSFKNKIKRLKSDMNKILDSFPKNKKFKVVFMGEKLTRKKIKKIIRTARKRMAEHEAKYFELKKQVVDNLAETERFYPFKGNKERNLNAETNKIYPDSKKEGHKGNRPVLQGKSG